MSAARQKFPDRLTGTDSQIAWAEQIRAAVNLEFDRVAGALESRYGRDAAPSVTAAILAIFEDKRAEVMSHSDAQYFIREWHERNDQVRLLLIHDPRYQAVLANRKTEAGARKS